MRIEPAHAGDLEEILALQRLAFQIEAERYGDYTLPPLTQTLDGLRADLESMVILKASVDGRIVGSARAYLEGDTCYVGRVVVHPDFWRQGIATQLMDAIESRFADARRFELFTGHASTPALELYRTRGYTEFKRKELPTHTLVFLEKWNRE